MARSRTATQGPLEVPAPSSQDRIQRVFAFAPAEELEGRQVREADHHRGSV